MAYFDSDGVQIYFEEHGKGEPVVLVHGFASRAEHNWGAMNWFTTLAAHYRVVALDCRGHGKSGKPHDPAAYDGETMGDDVIRLMDHLGIKRTLIMGYSMGARIVTGLADDASGASARRSARRNRRGDRKRAELRSQADRRCAPRREYFRSEGAARAGVSPVRGGDRQRPEGLGGVHGIESRGFYRRAYRGAEDSGAGDDRDRDEGSAGRAIRSCCMKRFPAASS